ncbi:M23 family metallopeptidase [Plantactinospora sp. WMMC1484]|uniref:M23 family metallopeptidase n=1 Tax=Plantactinospora sp. WMMC1484 TaxID=3404122 RepID=UPI003BF58BC0
MRKTLASVLIGLAVAAGSAVAAAPAAAAPNFRAPWPCGQQRQYYHHSTEVTNAIDFNLPGSADLGTPALASAAGTVTQTVHNDAGYGNYVRVSHGGGWTTLVAHLQSISVSQGQAVAAGRELGKVGSTGQSTGPHLHYEQELNNVNQRIVIDGVALRYSPEPATHTSGNCGGGSGPDEIGVYRPDNATFYLRNGATARLGSVGDVPVTGDWNRDGVDSIGVYRPDNRTFYLKNGNSSGDADGAFYFGNPGDVPVVGDWNGDGYDTIGVYRPDNRTFYLKNSNDNSGVANVVFSYGNSGDVPVVGDWDGDGVDTIGMYRPGNRTFYLKNSNSSGNADGAFVFGNDGDVPMAGNWDGDPYDTIGVYRPGNRTFYLKNRNDNAPADLAIVFGNFDDVPLSGRWR